jgi:hypothetical protein
MPLLTDIKSWDTILTQDEMNEVDKIVSRPRWQFGATSHIAAPHKKFWKMDVKGCAIFDTIIQEKIKVLVPFKFEILDYYVNGHTRALDGYMHTDDADYTFLIFCNPVWDLVWGGKTIFVQDDGRYDAVFPKPGSAVLFPSNMMHYAEDVSREFYGIRVTAAYKLKKVEDTDAELTDV